MCNNLMGCRKTLVCLGAFILAGPADLPALADSAIEELVENVRRNERLYDNIDVTMKYEYQLPSEVIPTIANASVAGRTTIVTHYVSQDGMFRLAAEGESQTADGRRSENRLRAFDGKVTRVYEQNAVGNIISGRADDSRGTRPHTLLIRHMPEARAPLSVFLSGEKAVRAHPLNRLSPKLDLVVSYDGTTDFQGLLCHNVAVGLSTKTGTPVIRHELLLAEERNYLPIRMRSYTFRWSTNLPIAEGVVTDLKEVTADIWFPYAVRIEAFNPFPLHEKSVQEVGWTDTYSCESVSLEPDYPLSYFSDVRFPDGTAVYQVDGAKITHAFRQGRPAAIHGASRVAWQRWLLWTINGFAVLVVSFVILKRRFFSGRRAS